MVTKILQPEPMGAGPFKDGQAGGITIHYSGDRDVNRVIASLNEKKLGYHILIDRDGSVIQTCFFNQRVNHAGKAIWNNASPNRKHIAICLMSWGKLDDSGTSWSGQKINDSDVVERKDLFGNTFKWDKCTDIQESRLKEIIGWLSAFGIPYSSVCGHDECAIPPGRKQDPGGVLSFPVDDFRKRAR